MDYTGKNLNLVVAIDESSDENYLGQQNITLRNFKQSSEGQQWIYDSKKQTIQSILYKNKKQNKVLDYDVDSPFNLIVDFYVSNNLQQKFTYDSEKNQFFNIGTHLVLDAKNNLYFDGNAMQFDYPSN